MRAKISEGALAEGHTGALNQQHVHAYVETVTLDGCEMRNLRPPHLWSKSAALEL